VEYARERRIRIVPEFDIPGHTTSWLVGYPHLASAPEVYKIERGWGVFKPTMDPSRETTFEFLDAFFNETTSLFPDKYFHIGGDEVEGSQWTRSNLIQTWKTQLSLSTNHDIQRYFTRRVQQLLSKYNRFIVGWDEILSAVESNSSSVIQSWRDRRSLIPTVHNGQGAILSFQFYLDGLDPAGTHYSVNPMKGIKWLFNKQQTIQVFGGEA
ncbi:unnamed protein product, partial [Didymodactylos carnosus]